MSYNWKLLSTSGNRSVVHKQYEQLNQTWIKTGQQLHVQGASSGGAKQKKVSGNQSEFSERRFIFLNNSTTSTNHPTILQILHTPYSTVCMRYCQQCNILHQNIQAKIRRTVQPVPVNRFLFVIQEWRDHGRPHAVGEPVGSSVGNSLACMYALRAATPPGS